MQKPGKMPGFLLARSPLGTSSRQSGIRQASNTCKSLSRAKFITKFIAMGSRLCSRWSTTTHLTPFNKIGLAYGLYTKCLCADLPGGRYWESTPHSLSAQSDGLNFLPDCVSPRIKISLGLAKLGSAIGICSWDTSCGCYIKLRSPNSYNPQQCS